MKLNNNVHILPDENLGGVLREYVEVDRNADVGDFVVRGGIIRKVTETELGANEYMICKTCRGSGGVDAYNNQLDEVIPEVCPDCKGKGYFE